MITIGVAAAQVGVSTSALRKWESRYGLPVPRRDSAGVRHYSAAEVASLKDIKRRIDLGHKTSGAMQAVLSAGWADTPAPESAVGEVATLMAAPVAGAVSAAAAVQGHGAMSEALNLLRHHGASACHQWLQAQRSGQSAQGFVEHVAAPLLDDVGEAWARGEVSVYEEHALSALLQSALPLPLGTSPLAAQADGPGLCLLATWSGERHTLGLTMLHAVLHEAGVPCTNLGADVPHADLVAASQHWGASVLALSLSAATAPRLAHRRLQVLRAALPARVALWVGGAGAGHLARLPAGVQAFVSCAQARDEWLAHTLAPAGAGGRF